MAKQIKQKMGMQKLGLVFMVLIILFSGYVFAFGVGSAYHKDHPLEISPGETMEIIFNLQNGPGPDDITARGSVTKGSEIMEMVDSGNILVVVGGSVDVKVRVSMPSDAKIGDVYPVEISFTTITEGEAGAFGLGSSVGRGFDVIVVPTAEERARLAEQGVITSWIVYLIVGIVILIIILVIWFVPKKRKSKFLKIN